MKRATASLRRIGRAAWASRWLALALIVCRAALAQEGPRLLPLPEVSVDRLLPASRPAGPYLGPPAGIDGPPAIEVLPDALAPGIGPESNLPPGAGPLADGLVAGELYYEPQKLSEHKSGFFQKLSLSAGWFGDGSDPEDLGGTELEAFVTVALPAPIKEWPLLITPAIHTTLLDGPTITDLPPRLYFAYVDFMWVPTIVHRWTLVAAVAPSVYGDFDANEFRLTGKALVLYDWVPDRLQVVAGVLYLNRENVQLLPAGGVIWRPAEWARLEILFPKPKLAVRYNVGPGFEDWLFSTAEFGGNSWPIERASGLDDTVTYLDYRLLVGMERKLDGGAGWRLEAGYVFGRSIEFTSGLGNFDPQDTVILRGVIVF
jgi:hypothetical protein